MPTKPKSIFKGVYWEEKRKKWRSSIRINGRTVNLGRYQTEIQAHNAYQRALTDKAILEHGNPTLASLRDRIEALEAFTKALAETVAWLELKTIPD